PVVAVRTAGERAAVAQAHGARVARQRLQPIARFGLLALARPRIADDPLQLRALRGVLLHELQPLLVADPHRLLSHPTSPRASRAQREPERLEQRSPVGVVPCRRRDADVQAANRVDLVVVDLRENDLLPDTDVVVALPVERARREPAEIADTRNRDVDQPIEELVHPLAAQRDLAADRHALADLEARDRPPRVTG